jgi:hypothetical protein
MSPLTIAQIKTQKSSLTRVDPTLANLTHRPILPLSIPNRAPTYPPTAVSNRQSPYKVGHRVGPVAWTSSVKRIEPAPSRETQLPQNQICSLYIGCPVDPARSIRIPACFRKFLKRGTSGPISLPRFASEGSCGRGPSLLFPTLWVVSDEMKDSMVIFQYIRGSPPAHGMWASADSSKRVPKNVLGHKLASVSFDPKYVQCK